MTNPSRRILPPIWLFASILASYALNRWLPLAPLLPQPWNFAGLALILLGGTLSITSALSFKRAGTPVMPFAPSTALVTGGWYRFTRNPMYLGLGLILTGVALMGGSLGALLPLPVFIAVIQFRFIHGEERFLQGIFGQQYLDYCSRVRRWI